MCLAAVQQYGGTDFNAESPGQQRDTDVFSGATAVEFWVQSDQVNTPFVFRIANLKNVSSRARLIAATRLNADTHAAIDALLFLNCRARVPSSQTYPLARHKTSKTVTRAFNFHWTNLAALLRCATAGAARLTQHNTCPDLCMLTHYVQFHCMQPCACRFRWALSTAFSGKTGVTCLDGSFTSTGIR
jgi:hypothetical protein